MLSKIRQSKETREAPSRSLGRNVEIADFMSAQPCHWATSWRKVLESWFFSSTFETKTTSAKGMKSSKFLPTFSTSTDTLTECCEARWSSISNKFSLFLPSKWIQLKSSGCSFCISSKVSSGKPLYWRWIFPAIKSSMFNVCKDGCEALTEVSEVRYWWDWWGCDGFLE